MIVPVAWVLGLAVVIVGAIVTATWRLLRWQEARIKAIVTDAAQGWTAAFQAAISEHDRRIATLEARDEERSESIRRLHTRVDEAVVLVAKGGRP